MFWDFFVPPSPQKRKKNLRMHLLSPLTHSKVIAELRSVIVCLWDKGGGGIIFENLKIYSWISDCGNEFYKGRHFQYVNYQKNESEHMDVYMLEKKKKELFYLMWKCVMNFWQNYCLNYCLFSVTKKAIQMLILRT